MPLWDVECDNLVDQHLDINKWDGSSPKYKHRGTLNDVEEANLPNGIELISSLYTQMVKNWIDGGRPNNTSDENWRFKQRIDIDPNNKDEVMLESTIISVLNSKNWANQIPVDSGLLNTRSSYLDLAYKEGDAIELIELKVGKKADTPLSAAFQILKYGLINAFFRIHSIQPKTEGGQTPLLRATEIKLRVLAPAENYGYFKNKIEWLKKLEESFNNGLTKFSENQLGDIEMNLAGFQFTAFPDNFHWDRTRHADDEHRNEVLTAVNGRRPL